MKARWTRAALRHLHEAYDYIHLDKPPVAERMVGLIEAASNQLGLFPQIGRPSRRPKTREFAVPATPFILFYRVAGAEVEILAIFHGAQNWMSRI